MPPRQAGPIPALFSYVYSAAFAAKCYVLTSQEDREKRLRSGRVERCLLSSEPDLKVKKARSRMRAGILLSYTIE